jgi:hypothetical protein
LSKPQYQLSDAARKSPPTKDSSGQPVTDAIVPLASPAIHLQVVAGKVSVKLSERVLYRLAQAESRESDVWLRDDYRIAWLTVLYASEERTWGLDDEGESFGPWEFAFVSYLGKSHKKLIPYFVARSERHRLLDVPDYDPTLDKRFPPSPVSPRKRAVNEH